MAQLSLEPPVYKLGALRFSPMSGVLEVSGEKVALRAREANLLNALIKSFPEVLSRSEIEAQLWKDSYATNATINQTIKSLRFSLKDDERTIIRTIPKQGYLLSKKPVIESVPAEEEPITESAEPLFELTHLNRSNRIYFYAATVASIIAFAMGVFGVGVEDHSNMQISQKHDNAWYLLEEVPESLREQVSNSYPSGEVAVMRSKESYQVCRLDVEVMICKKFP
ncbi:transcriptional regulator [Vibrio breoganii]